MKTIFYNTTTGLPGQRFTPQYLVDGKPGELPAHLIELAYLPAERPEITANEVAESTWIADTVNGEYRQEWSVRDKTEEEIADEIQQRAEQMDNEMPAMVVKSLLREKVESEVVDEEDLADYAELYPTYRPHKDYVLNQKFRHPETGELWKALQPHTSAPHWKIEEAVSLYVRVRGEGGVIEPWKQPAGGHDAYQIGEKVTHNGATWENDTKDNVWEPGVYGWVKL